MSIFIIFQKAYSSNVVAELCLKHCLRILKLDPLEISGSLTSEYYQTAQIAFSVILIKVKFHNSQHTVCP